MRSYRSAPSRVVSCLGNALLNVLAVLGVVCTILVIAGFVFNISIIMFKTGSMSPSIPAGSIALVREVPAQEIAVGDIVTVDRGETTLPVTHRVVSILESDEASGQVTFEMRGDANNTKDPEPYTAQTVRTVLGSVPGIAPILNSWRNPFVLGSITVAASLLVAWAFWPRRTQEPQDDHQPEVSEQEQRPTHARTSMKATGRGPKHAVVAPAVMLVLLGGGAPSEAAGPTAQGLDAGPVATTATTSTNHVDGDVLRMREFGDKHQMRNLSPGNTAKWSVDVWAEPPDPGTVTLRIGSSHLAEPLGSSIVLDVRACPRPATNAPCPRTSPMIVDGETLADIGSTANADRELLEMPSTEAIRVEVNARLKPDADPRELAGLTSNVRITAIGHGEEISTGLGDSGSSGLSDDIDAPALAWPGEGLPRTGVEGWQWILLAALLLIVTGAAMIARARRTEELRQ